MYDEDDVMEVKNRLKAQALILKSRKRQREEEEKNKIVDVLKKITQRIEEGIDQNIPFVVISDKEYEVAKTFLSEFEIKKSMRGNPLDREEPRTAYIINCRF
jgi:hypothetical protein